MNKPGRNGPCRCGSGQKYKKCCAEKDAAAESRRLAANKARIEAQKAKYQQQLKETAELHRAQLSGQWDEEDPLTQESGQEGQDHATRAIFGRDGCGDPVVETAGADRTALPEGG
jgi:SEC-C motif